jgi:hypothetical protein
MKRFTVLLSCTVVCAALVLTFLTTTATPSWSELDQTVSVSKQPVAFECYQRCDHAGQGGVCMPFPYTWTCWTDQGSCQSVKVCIQ